MDVEYGSPEELLLIQAWRKRQDIELRKLLALATVAVNPNKFSEIFKEIVALEFPETTENEKQKDIRQAEMLKDEAEYVYRISPSAGGFEAVKERLKK